MPIKGPSRELKRLGVPAIAAGAYSALVLVALFLTLQSLSENDFDGLNNILQLPLALPWAILPVSVKSHS